MSVLVAAGPYTLESDLEFEPLEALIGLAKQESIKGPVCRGKMRDNPDQSIVQRSGV
jgi:hypothetical protein